MRDEHFVRNLANKYNVKFYIKSFETKTYAKKERSQFKWRPGRSDI